MNLYSLSDKIVFNILRDIKYGYLEITTYQGILVKFGNKDDSLKASMKIKKPNKLVKTDKQEESAYFVFWSIIVAGILLAVTIIAEYL